MEKQLDYIEELRKIMGRRQKSLETALDRMAEAIGIPAPSEAEVTAFFRDLIDGDWDAFDEATSYKTEEMRVLDDEILKRESEILDTLGRENLGLFNKYISVVNSRTTAELEYAYLAGYQTGIRLLLMGILPLKSFTSDATNGASAVEEEN